MLIYLLARTISKYFLDNFFGWAQVMRRCSEPVDTREFVTPLHVYFVPTSVQASFVIWQVLIVKCSCFKSGVPFFERGHLIRKISVVVFNSHEQGKCQMKTCERKQTYSCKWGLTLTAVGSAGGLLVHNL